MRYALALLIYLSGIEAMVVKRLTLGKLPYSYLELGHLLDADHDLVGGMGYSRTS